MPLYHFVCEHCTNECTELLPMNHEPVLCDVCKKVMKKLISKSSAHYKGTGFYTTDYKDKN